MAARLYLLVCGILGASTVARAAVVEPLDLPQLVAASDRIVVGTVGAAQAHQSADGRLIVTDTWLQVESTLKGPAADRLAVRTSGGVVGERGQRVPGAARLLPGERVLLFLEAHGELDGAPLCRVVAMALGKFTLRADAEGGQVAVRDLRGLSAPDPTRGTVAPLAGQAPIALPVLLREIRALVGSPVRPATP